MRHIVTHAGMNCLPFLGHEKWEKNHWTVRVVRNCLSAEVASGARRRTSLTLISPSARTHRISRGAHQEQPISAAREHVPPHAPERTGQLNSRHSHESQPEQSNLVCRVPESAVVVMMTAAAIIFLVIVAVVIVIVSTLTICFFGARPIETIFGAFGFLAVD